MSETEQLEYDIETLKKKINAVLSNPQCRVIYPIWSDYSRDVIYKFSSVSRWVGLGVPTSKKIYTKRERAFAFASHATFDNIYDCDPSKQRIQRYKNYALSRRLPICPQYYSSSYYAECGKTSSFWTVSHLKDIINDKYFAHSVILSVMMDTKLRKPKQVLPAVKELIDDHWNNMYPQTLKPKYYNLKNILLSDMKILDQFKNNKNLLYSYPIQLRYDDEDSNHHLSISTYIKYINEGLLMFEHDLRRNKKVIYCMSNVYWKEIRMKFWNHCYVNIWNVKEKRLLNGKNIKLYIGTVDIDKKYCKRNNDEINFERDNNKHEWMHCHGFVAGIIDVDSIKSKL